MIVTYPPNSTTDAYYTDIMTVNIAPNGNTANNIVNITASLIPTANNVYGLGTTGAAWKEIVMGPGTLTILGPSGSTSTATLGSNLNGIAYTESGFASPFLNVGPSINPLVPAGTVGGWKISVIGATGATGANLIAQQIGESGVGVTGATYSLAHPNITGSTTMQGTTYAPDKLVFSIQDPYTQVFYNTSTKKFVYNLQTISDLNNKTFVIDHPVDPNKYLVHACLEGPEAGVYYRGEDIVTNGKNVRINLPNYVDKLATNFTVQITPIYDDETNIQKVYTTSRVTNNTFTVHGPSGSFYWHVYGERSKITTEPYKHEVEVKGNGPYKWI